jgi:hypothetical protein
MAQSEVEKSFGRCTVNPKFLALLEIVWATPRAPGLARPVASASPRLGLPGEAPAGKMGLRFLQGGVVRLIPYCARPTRAFPSRALREHGE